MGSKIANVIFEKLYSRIDFNKEQYILYKGCVYSFL